MEAGNVMARQSDRAKYVRVGVVVCKLHQRSTRTARNYILPGFCLHTDLHNNHCIVISLSLFLMEIRVFSSSPLAQFPCLFWCRSQSHPEVRLCFWQIPPCSLHTDIPTFPCTFPPYPVIYLFFSLCTSDRTLQPHSGLAALQAYRRDTMIICLYLRFLFFIIIIFTTTKLLRSHGYGFSCYCNWKEYFLWDFFVFYYCFITDRRAEGISARCRSSFFLGLKSCTQ